MKSSKELKKENDRLRRLISKAMKYGAEEAAKRIKGNFDYIDTTKFFVKNKISQGENPGR